MSSPLWHVVDGEVPSFFAKLQKVRGDDGSADEIVAVLSAHPLPLQNGDASVEILVNATGGFK